MVPEDRGQSNRDTADDAPSSANTVGRRSIRQNVFDLLGSQAVTWALASVLIVQPRFLGADGQGQLRLAYSIWLVMDVLVGLGTSTYLTLEIARDRARGLALVRPVLIARMLGFIVAWLGVAGFLAVTGADESLVYITILVGISTMFMSVAGAARAALIGIEHMRYPARADIMTKVVTVSVVLAVLLAGGNAIAVASVSVLTGVFNAGLMWMFLRRFRHSDASSPPRIGVRTVVAGALVFLVADAALVIYQQVDVVVMSFLVDEEQLGWYAASDQLFGSLLFVPTILMIALFPAFGRLRVEDPERMNRLFTGSLSSLLLFSVPIGLGVVAIGRPLTVLLFGSDFAGAGPVLAVLGIVLIITSETVLIGRYAIATGHQRVWNILMIGAILLTIPLDLVLVPFTDRRFDNGAVGGALAYVVTETIMLAVGVKLFARAVLNLETLLRMGKILSCGLLMLAVIWPLRNQPLVVPVVVGAIIYTIGLFVTSALSDVERGVLTSVGRKLRRAR